MAKMNSPNSNFSGLVGQVCEEWPSCQSVGEGMAAPHRSQHCSGLTFREGPIANGPLPRRKAVPWEGGSLEFAVEGQEANGIWSSLRTPFS